MGVISGRETVSKALRPLGNKYFPEVNTIISGVYKKKNLSLSFICGCLRKSQL